MRSTCLSVLALTLAIAGCDSKTTTLPPGSAAASTGPHGGALAQFPGDAGLGEVVIETTPQTTGENAIVAVYFLQPDARTPLATPPASASVKLNLPDGSKAEIPLAPEPKSGDPASAARFASKPGPYLIDQVMGELTATLNGQPATAPFPRP
jgi:hypothetical protein